MKIILGVTGGIAAYKAVYLLRLFTEAGHSVRVVPTSSALRFVGKPTWAALSGQPVAVDVWTDAHDVPHVQLGRDADVVVVAPATADLLARAAHGLADDLLTNILLTTRAPVLYAPAMHTEMWEHAATAGNVALLRSRGALVLEPAFGRLTGVDSGHGRFPEPYEIAWVAQRLSQRGAAGLAADLTGRHVVISAGGTREMLDPVRFIGNRSSGRQGYALARMAVARGARVTLIAANTQLPHPAGVEVIPVTSTRDLRDAVLASSIDADVVVMAAAPADFRPAKIAETKIKRALDGSAPMIELTQNPDIVRALVDRRAAQPDNNASNQQASRQVIVGFAAETGDEQGSVLDYGWAKLRRKGCDLLVVNDVGNGHAFEGLYNAGVILSAEGDATEISVGTKEDLADAVWDQVVRHLQSQFAG